MTDGENPISGMKFATRLVQKLINYLTTQTRDGRAYELDMRLRPSGNAGVMVISLAAFSHYQKDKAWVWEHQALVRARGLCGDAAVLTGFDAVRQAVLTSARDLAVLKKEVMDMRDKMREHLSDKHKDAFHLKQDRGGLVDIEFMAQYCVLAYAHRYPALAVYSDNVRIFEAAVKTGVWSEARCQTLNDAYLNIRKATHEQALAQEKALGEVALWEKSRQEIMAIWQEIFEDAALKC